jgi:uncharacterized protein YbaR (Trm112 family)
MLDSSLEFLRCVRCSSKLELDVFKTDQEIEEGLLKCKKCTLKFPIIEKIPILWNNFPVFLSSHKKLNGKLYRLIKNQTLKDFFKSSLSEIKPADEDRTALEERWTRIYQNNKNSKFYSTIKNNIDTLQKSNLVLEHGCSIGIMTSYLADTNKMVFGIDRSFSALQVAKESSKNNLDYFVADSLSSIFGKLQFDLILGLNILELIEPSELLKYISKQISSGYLVLADPYDFDRGSNSVKKPLDESTLRTTLKNFGFKITPKTKNPSFISWNLKLNPRATLNYKVDLIIGKK